MICLQGSQEVKNADDDDYFHSEAGLPCIPDVPDSLKSESDSIDLDELPCIVPENLEVLEGTPVEASMSDPDEYRIPTGQHRASPSRLSTAAASITRSTPLACDVHATIVLQHGCKESESLPMQAVVWCLGTCLTPVYPTPAPALMTES